MAVIEHIVIRCLEQEDITFDDDLKVLLNGTHVGSVSNISSGETRDVDKSVLFGDLFVNEGTVLRIEEEDWDSNDVLLEHTITSSDISNGSVTVRDQISSARYEFEIHIIDF